MHRIVLTAPPRSGVTYFFNHVRDSFFHNDFDHANPRDAGEWSQRDSWIIISHEPLMLKAHIPSVVNTTIVRNPLDWMASIINKHSFGFGNSTIAGRPEIIEEHIKRMLADKDGWLNENLHQESMMWEGYTYHANNECDKIVPFTFEQVTSDIVTTIQIIHDATAEIDPNRGPVRLRSQFEIDEINRHMAEIQLRDPMQAAGATNMLPVDKSESYFEIREAVEKFERMPRLLDLYYDTVDKIEQRQKDFRFSFTGTSS